MAIVQVPDSELSYHLIAFDASGAEGEAAMTQRTADAATEATDVFVLSHGWLSDVPSAQRQYAAWLRAAHRAEATLTLLRNRQGEFRPLFVGLHWPSQPWGDESLESVAPPEDAPLIDAYADRLGDAPPTRQALQTIFTAARTLPTGPARLPDNVVRAYDALNTQSRLRADDVGAAPGSDRERFDPQAIYSAAREDGPVAFGLLDSAWEMVLTPLRQLSFWKMKDRARIVGESGVHNLLRQLQQRAPTVRLHLMGHSFGCIVASAALAGPPSGVGLDQPVHSLLLVQGAMSLWSYCDDIPHRLGTPGYFRRVAEGRVEGPIVTTRSRHDLALGRWYPLGARVAGQVEFAPGEFPKFGAIGAFGLQGPSLSLGEDSPLLGQNEPYTFRPGRVYNLDAASVIRTGGGLAGAHNDIAHPELGHLLWSAALAPALRLSCNGIDATTGGYITPPLTPRQVTILARGGTLDKDEIKEMRDRANRSNQHYGVIEGIDAQDLGDAGWGVIFAQDAPAGVREALEELFAHRKAQTSRYREYVGPMGVRAGEKARDFVKRFRADIAMPVDPTKVPYYLLIVADPESIPYNFQSQLDVQYAVARLWFEKDGQPDLDAFRTYARNVVKSEKPGFAQPRRATFFGVRNKDDEPTELSDDFLITALPQRLQVSHPGWQITTQHKTKRADLIKAFGEEAPGLLFTASHGVSFPNGHANQVAHQGALLCQDWPGPFVWGRNPNAREHYFAADDVPAGAQLNGAIVFHFACYGLGTPRMDDYPHLQRLMPQTQIAPKPFVARLPQQLLKAGALAVVGHVERAWSCSFYGGAQMGVQLQVFQSALERLLNGGRVGSSMEYFNSLYAALSTELSTMLEEINNNIPADNWLLSSRWTANNDARSYLILGDPAVRIANPAGPG